MLLLSWKKALLRKFGRQCPTAPVRRNRPLPFLEPHGDRIVPAVTASFLTGPGVLTVFGDSQTNTITVSRDVAGKFLVNDEAVPVVGGTATVANTALIQVFGQDGNDTISLDEANGALPAALVGPTAASQASGGRPARCLGQRLMTQEVGWRPRAIRQVAEVAPKPRADSRSAFRRGRPSSRPDEHAGD